MKPVAIAPSLFNKNGDINLNYFLLIGSPSVKEWLRLRLSPTDPSSTVNTAYEEDPSRLVIEIFRQAGLASEVSRIIGEEILSLLESATQELPCVAEYLPYLLEICKSILIPSTESWFITKLSMGAHAPNDFMSSFPSSDLRKQVIAAAAVQVPLLHSTRTSDLWPKVLQSPELGTTALYGFGATMDLQVPQIQEWWRCAPETTRDSELREICRGYLSEDRKRFRSLLFSIKEQWPKDLSDALDCALEYLNDIPVSVHAKDAEYAIAELNSLLDSPTRRSHAERVIKKEPILMINSSYTGLRALNRLKNDVLELLNSLRIGDKLETRVSNDFSDLADSVLRDTHRMIFSFPLYLTDDRRHNFFVIPYGNQSKLGIVIPQHSSILSIKARLIESNNWNMSGLLGQMAKVGVRTIYCPKNYAVSEIVKQAMVQASDFNDVKDIRIIEREGPNQRERHSSRRPELAKILRSDTDQDSVWLFDIGEMEVYTKYIKSMKLKPEQYPVVESLSHDLDIPVGLGFNLYMLPWILDGDNWEKVEEGLRKITEGMGPILESIGITPLNRTDRKANTGETWDGKPIQSLENITFPSNAPVQ